MKKFMFFIGLVAVTPAPAQLTLISGSKFSDNNNDTINYPCSYGGKPLAIWSNEDNKSIHSQQPISPSYVYPGFQASNLTVSTIAQSKSSSSIYLIVQSPNPGNKYHNLEFTLQKIDQSNFNVSSVNFSPAINTTGQKDVSILQVATDGYANAFPITNDPFVEDTGVFVEQNVDRIDAKEFTWNQKTAWYNPGQPVVEGLIKYQFSPKPDNSGNLNGFGFWICGDPNPQQQSQPMDQQAARTYVDKIFS